MRLHILSDLHNEFSQFEYQDNSPPECDLVILAGDTHPGTIGAMWAAKTYSVPVIYVSGNHEYYGRRSLLKHTRKIQAAIQGTNVHVLNNQTYEQDGCRFLCATLWTDFNLLGDPAKAHKVALEQINDYKRIREIYNRPLKIEHVWREFQTSVAFLKAELEKSYAGKTVIVTHHAPSLHSIPQIYRNDPLSASYASNLEDLIAQHDIDLFVHGHTHHPADYILHGTRIISNPRGYVFKNQHRGMKVKQKSEFTGFIPDLVIGI